MSVSYCLLNFLSPSSGFYLKTGCMKHCFSALVQSFSYRDVVTLFCVKLLCFESLVAKLSHYNSFFFQIPLFLRRHFYPLTVLSQWEINLIVFQLNVRHYPCEIYHLVSKLLAPLCQRCIYNSVEYLRWSFSVKIVSGWKPFTIFHKNSPWKMFWLVAKYASVSSSILLSFFPSKSFVSRRIKFTSFMMEFLS